MQNKGRLPSYLTLKMYHRHAASHEVTAEIRSLWEELTEYEVRLVLQEDTLKALHGLTKERAEDTAFMGANYLRFINGIDWLYILKQHGKVLGFMAVGGGEVSSLFLKEDFRGRGIGTFLLHNHLEIFDAALKLKVSKVNAGALAMYLKAGFIVTDEDRVYYTMQYQFVKPVDRLIEQLST